MDIKQICCTHCGSSELKKEGQFYVCASCKRMFAIDTLTEEVRALSLLLDAEKQEEVSALRSMLYDAVNRIYINSQEIFGIARDLRKLLPDDFRATFYATVCGQDPKSVVKWLGDIDVDKNEEDMEEVVAFLVKSLHPAWLLVVADLIERAFHREGKRHLHDTWLSRYETEAQRVSAGIYQTDLPRDVFIAYSSSDSDKVIELADYLEQLGFSCFVALRNLQHGIGAVQNYEAELQKALRHCRVFLLVSSRHSRSLSCDAFTKELQFLWDSEMRNAPPEYRNGTYEALPAQYKKPRIEYVIEDYLTPANPFESVVKQFFSGLTWCRTKEDTAATLATLLHTFATTAEEECKYCGDCGTKNDLTTKFCRECGCKVFLASKEAYDAYQIEKAKKEADQKRAEAERKAREAIEAEKKALEAKAREAEAKALAEKAALMEQILALQKQMTTPSAPATAPTIVPSEAPSKPQVELTDEELFLEKAPLLEAAKVGDVLTLGKYKMPTAEKPVDVEWQVLHREGNKVLLLSTHAIIKQIFNTANSSGLTWKNSQLRRWLNVEFYTNTFASFEKDIILPTASPDADVLFLLSADDVAKYLPQDEKRVAKRLDAPTFSCDWWLRSEGVGKDMVAFVNGFGQIEAKGRLCSVPGHYVRPAMWVDVSFASSPSPAEVLKKAKKGDKISFGSYAQSFPTFKEPITWLVLDKQENNLLLFAEYGLERKAYHGTKEDITWERSYMRKWLAETFYADAFSQAEQKFIHATRLTTPKNAMFGTEGGKATTDKVFLLSMEEIEQHFGQNNLPTVSPSPLVLRATTNPDISYKSYWLRTAGKRTMDAVVVDSQRVWQMGSYAGNPHLVRPAIWVNIDGKPASESAPFLPTAQKAK